MDESLVLPEGPDDSSLLGLFLVRNASMMETSETFDRTHDTLCRETRIANNGTSLYIPKSNTSERIEATGDKIIKGGKPK